MTVVSPQPSPHREFLVSAAWVLVVGLIASVGVAYADSARPDGARAESREVAAVAAPVQAVEPAPLDKPTPEAEPRPPGPARIERLPKKRTLVAYYGTPSTAALGVLGEGSLRRMTTRLRAAARPFGTKKHPAQIVYEVIVTVADPFPGRGRDYNHDIARAEVRRMIAAAHRYDALIVLDLQPGRAGFLKVAKRWEWALRDPRVGLALDPEWRMGPRSVPGQVIGSVSAAEINRVSGWLSRLVVERALPQKIFVLHAFRTSMIRGLGQVRQRPALSTILHVDGFGTPSQKRATYDVVTRGWRGPTGFKLFYDEDIRRMNAAQVGRLAPRVDLVTFQ